MRDCAFHLEFLEAALRESAPEVFTRYSAWLGTVLTQRRVPAEVAEANYDDLLHVLARWAPEARPELERLIAAGRAALREPAPVPGARSGPQDPASERLLDALLRADRREVQEIVSRAAREGRSVQDLADRVVQPAMARLGQLWQENQVSVAQEHLASALVQAALARSVAMVPAAQPNGRKVLVACVEGNQHSLGARLVADALETQGWEVRYLGADVPTRDLAALAASWRPNLVALSLSLPQHVATARRAIATLREAVPAGVRIAVGGIPIHDFPALAQVVGADEHHVHAAGLLPVPG